MQLVASFEAIHLNGINSQAALHGAVTETMIGSNAPTRITSAGSTSGLSQESHKLPIVGSNPTPATNVTHAASRYAMHTMEHELTCELEGRFKVGYNLQAGGYHGRL